MNQRIVLSSPTRTKSPDLSELLPSLIISRAFPPISSIVLPVPYAKKYTSAKRAADWVMLRLTIKTLLNQLRDISTSLTILKNTWWFVAFPSIQVILKATLSPCGINECFSFLQFSYTILLFVSTNHVAPPSLYK